MKAPKGNAVKLTGCELFQIELFNDNIYIYDGFESQGKYINFISGNQTSDMFYQTSNGETMEVVFKRYFRLFYVIFNLNLIILNKIAIRLKNFKDLKYISISFRLK